MSQVYRARHGLRPARLKPRRVVSSVAAPRAHISHAGISSQRVEVDHHGRRAVIVTLAALAILDGFLAILIGLR